MNQDFQKYEASGAYHWTIALERGRLRSCPQLNARYDIPLDIVRRHVPLQSARGLDIGCGDGMLVYKARRKGARVQGLDYSEEGLRLAREKLAAHGVSSEGLHRGSVYELPFSDASFDYVTCVELIEHLDDPKRMLSEVLRVLKPGGIFVCTTPNGNRRLLPGEVRDPYHEHEFPPAELRVLLGRFFGNGTVRGVGHAALDSAYRFRAGSVALKLLNAAGVNAFRLHRSAGEPRRRWTTLVGVGVKPDFATAEARVALHHQWSRANR